jgi:hypothetical protein
VYRDDEPSLQITAAGPAWIFNGDAQLFRLVSEARRVRLADLFDPMLAVFLSPTGLNPGGHASVIVRPDRAVEQLEEQKPAAETEAGSAQPAHEEGSAGPDVGGDRAARRPVRFHGIVRLDPRRLSHDFGKVATEVVSHLSSLPGTEVGAIVEIAARNDEGLPEAARNVSENAKTLKFDNFGFEER